MTLNIAIIGAGIGGPAASIGLAKKGHRVTIFERSTRTQEVGYSFRLTPNSDRCLKSLDIDSEAGGACAANVTLRFDANGQSLTEIGKENQDTKPKQGASGRSVFVFRPQLNAQLLKRCKELGVQMRIGEGVKNIDIDTNELTLDGGEKLTADLIIAADGMRSAVRPKIIDSKRFYPKDSTEQEAFRFMLDRDTVLNDSVMKEVVKEEVPMFSWVGNSKILLIYPVDFGKQFNFTCMYPAKLRKQSLDESQLLSYDARVSQETALGLFSDFPKEAQRLIELGDFDGFRVWKLVDMDEIGSWSKQNTVLIGDACHPVLPSSFSGASMAIEDAVTLAEVLPADVKKTEIASRLRLYQSLRSDRVQRVREAGRYNARLEENEESVAFRKEYMKFLSQHDAIAHAKEGLRQAL